MSELANPVCVIRARRTPIGREHGALKDIDPAQLAAIAIRAVLGNVSTAAIDRVILGNVANRGNIARVAALAAGLPPATDALTLNAQCTSGLTAIRTGYEAVRAGEVQMVIAGGVESVSQSAVWLGAGGLRRATTSGLTRVSHAPSPYADPDMGPAADTLAAELGISRDDQDTWALTSYERTAEARRSSFFEPLLAAVPHPGGILSADEMPRRSPAPRHLRRFPPAYTADGAVTAGNAALLGDGASMALVGSSAAARAAGLEPIARVVAAAAAGANPAAPPLAAIAAAKAVLAKARLRPPDIDLWEINEAFAAKVVACIRQIGIEEGRVNVNGGAIAYGHPFAASGSILIVHLAAALQRTGARYGLAAIAGAGGLGEAMIIERC